MFSLTMRRGSWIRFAMFAIVLWSARGAPACSCFPTGVKLEIESSNTVFRGAVEDIKELPQRQASHWKRRLVTCRVSRVWKGTGDRRLSIYLREPGEDCVGARFEPGKEYLVFAIQQEARDYWLGDRLSYGWTDLMPDGTTFLTVNNFCDSTGAVRLERRALAALGRGRAPR